jgi:hypothetical protein
MTTSKRRNPYATVANCGSSYRDISDKIREVDIMLNHASVRNNIIRITSKFVRAYLEANDIAADENEIYSIASTALAQHAFGDIVSSFYKNI